MRTRQTLAKDMSWSKDWSITLTDLIAMREDAVRTRDAEVAEKLRQLREAARQKYPHDQETSNKQFYAEVSVLIKLCRAQTQVLQPWASEATNSLNNSTISAR
jgi:hypothetical protein